MAVLFNAKGEWDAYQSNGQGIGVNVTHQDGDGAISGFARHASGTGSLTGRVTDNAIWFVVTWPFGNAKGRYTGTRGFDGRVSGTTADLNHPESVASWWSAHKFPDLG
ncbi:MULTISPECIES: hypothetical protein [Streptomyces]|uniref:Uncharacterized protein n=1 Tax=Streptomyces dengpaensis TaxID=2049881 RepID=A0ABM6SX60_9ACTN|nr:MULTISPECIES: hypothetical protein [Streptomyces]AVH58976.1 hypothetical protein C4B68_28095 [Streptomyces dengpaensis]PIB05903.1 hypothetical protein B1C81_26630 [Streptomyces sp. HG99]